MGLIEFLRQWQRGRLAAGVTVSVLLHLVLVALVIGLRLPGTRYEARRGEPLIVAHGRFERIDRNENVLVQRLETLGPLARRVSEAELGTALPGAHHFGRR